MDSNFKTPEQQAQELIGPDIGMQQQALERQLALADQLRRPGPAHSTGLGAAFGGLGDMLNAYTGKKKDAAAEALRQQMMSQDLGQRRAEFEQMQGLIQALRSGGQGQSLQQPQQAQPSLGIPDLNYGPIR